MPDILTQDKTPATAPAAPQPSTVDAIDSLPSYEDGSAAPSPRTEPSAIALDPVTPPKPTVTPPVKTDSPDDLPSEPKPVVSPPAAPPVVADPKTIPELRKAYLSANEELTKFGAEKGEWSKRLDTEKKAAVEEAAKALRDQMEAIRKERDDLDQKLRFTSYKHSPEYSEKWQKPLTSAWERALEDIEGMTVENEDGSQMKVTPQHMQQLIAMPAGQAATAAAKMFGVAAPEILAHRREIKRLQDGAASAIDEWKTKGSEFTAKQEQETKANHESAQKLFSDTINRARESMPDIFGRPQDAAAQVFFDKGEQLVDTAFRGKGIPEGLTQAERMEKIVSAQSAVAARAAAFGAQRHSLMKAMATIKDLEAQLAGFKKSEPGSNSTKNAPSKPQFDRPEDAIDGLPSL